MAFWIQQRKVCKGMNRHSDSIRCWSKLIVPCEFANLSVKPSTGKKACRKEGMVGKYQTVWWKWWFKHSEYCILEIEVERLNSGCQVWYFIKLEQNLQGTRTPWVWAKSSNFDLKPSHWARSSYSAFRIAWVSISLRFSSVGWVSTYSSPLKWAYSGWVIGWFLITKVKQLT